MMVASSLNAHAPPFYPQMNWHSSITEEYYSERPHSPGSSGFVIADAFWSTLQVDDDELFDATKFPVSQEEMMELEQVDEINVLLAELEMLETQQELHHKLMEKTRDLRIDSDLEPAIRSKMLKDGKKTHFTNKQPRGGAFKGQQHFGGKKQFGTLQQPRAVN